MPSFKRKIQNISALLCISGMVMVANIPLLNGFEAHVVNVTATVCDYSEIRSKDFWKDYIQNEEFQLFKIQNLGNETIDSAENAVIILQQGNSGLIKNKLKAQLLAMKFNIDYLGVGDFLDEKENKTLEEISAEADLMLVDTTATIEEITEMKNLLEYWNEKEEITLCSAGGEIDLPPNPVITESLLINKIYINPDYIHKSTYDINEWVEIYNPTSSDFNLKNWKICDNYLCDTLSTTDLILGSEKYAIITDSASTWQFWDVPSDALRIVLGNPVGGELNNIDDMLVLRNPEGENIDQLNWGNVQSAWSNKNDDLWNPTGITGFSKGDILGRNPDGFDTNQVSDWKIYKLPSVTVLYPNGGEIFEIGKLYKVEWQAKNNEGGLDSDLLIDIWYSNDSGMTWANIVRNIENDGYYEDILEPCLEKEDGTCYSAVSSKARIKIIATDSKRNFMFSNFDISDRDFCPPEPSYDKSIQQVEEEKLQKNQKDELSDQSLPEEENSIQNEQTEEEILAREEDIKKEEENLPEESDEVLKNGDSTTEESDTENAEENNGDEGSFSVSLAA